jgi:hypothetical protein
VTRATLARLVTLAALATLGVAATSGSVSASPTACSPGGKVQDGRYIQVFCGPARATLVLGSRSIRFKPGECRRTKDFTTVTLGTYTVGNPPIARYLRIVGPRRDGTTRAGAVTWQVPGASDGIAHAKLTLVAKSTRGSFTGRSQSGLSARGSFTCR